MVDYEEGIENAGGERPQIVEGFHTFLHEA